MIINTFSEEELIEELDLKKKKKNSQKNSSNPKFKSKSNTTIQNQEAYEEDNDIEFNHHKLVDIEITKKKGFPFNLIYLINLYKDKVDVEEVRNSEDHHGSQEDNDIEEIKKKKSQNSKLKVE